MKKTRLQPELSEASAENIENNENFENNESIERVEQAETEKIEVGLPVQPEQQSRAAKRAFEVRWGIVCGACAILVFYLTVGFVVSWMILDKIAAQTSHSASPFGTWWQVLLFVLDIVFVLGIAGSCTMMILGATKRRKAHAAQ